MSSDRISLWDFHASVSETESMLGEEGMAEKHKTQKQCKGWEAPDFVLQKRKPRNHGLGR